MQLQDEVTPLFKESNGQISELFLKKATLLEACWQETLRLAVTLFTGMRIANEPVTLGGYDIPKDEWIVACGYFTARDPTIFPEPEYAFTGANQFPGLPS